MSALSGAGGDLELRRRFPDPVVLPAAALSGGFLTLRSDDFFPTDQVVLVHGSGVVTGFLHRDLLDRVTLHSSARGALNNEAGTRVSLSGVAAGPTVLATAGPSAQTAVLTAFRAALTDPVTEEIGLRRWPTVISDYITAGLSEGNWTGWRFQGQVGTWRLKRRALMADISSIGELFGEGTKAGITGTGTMEFSIDLYADAPRDGADPLLRYLLLTERASRIDARFYLRKVSTMEASPSCTDRTALIEALFFRAQLIVIDDETDCSTQDLVAGSIDFATFGPIRLGSDILPGP
jgi:hypothetical protein